MSRLKQINIVALVTFFGILLSACGGGSTQQSAIRVAFFAPIANTYVAATLKGMGMVTASGGIKVTQFDTGFDATKEFSQIQDAVTTGKFDAFILIPLDSVGLVPAVETAIKAGIKVVNTDLILGSDPTTSAPQVKGQTGSVINPPSNRAAKITQSIVNACKDLNPCNVGFMAGVPSIDFEQLIKKNLDALPASYPNIKIKAYQTGHGYVAAPAIPIAQNILQANPDLNLLAVSSDQAMAGAEQAVIAAGRVGKIKLLSSGGSCPAIDAVKAGRWYSDVVDLPETEGRLAMQIVVDAIRNGKPGPTGLNPLSSFSGDPILTKDNIGSFQCQWQG
jgi:ribose transport system substrate-binding protein